MKNKIDSREASDKYKGFRYQKLRLARKMIQLLKINKDAYIIGFPEYKDDSYILGENSKVLEQNKEYANNFTLNSEEVRKALLNFLENYFELRKDTNLIFIFHTNVKYSKERTSNMLESLGLEPLEHAGIQYLIDKNYEDKVVDFITKVTMYTYSEENKENKESKESKESKETDTVFLEQIKKMSKEEWIKFLKCVHFEFGQANLEELEVELLNEIKLCSYYNELHIGRENEIKNALLEMIDKRMIETEILKKAFNSDSLKNVYLELCNKGKALPFDPAHEAWEAIESDKEMINGVRNLREKIESICINYDKRSISRLNLEATTAKSEILKLDKKHMNSLKVRVYESMGKYFEDIFEYRSSYSYEELKECIKQLKDMVIMDITVLKTDYSYGLNNNRILEKLVMMLIDECFYAFDKE